MRHHDGWEALPSSASATPGVPAGWAWRRLKTAATYRVSSVDKVPVDTEQPIRLCNYTDVYYNEFLHTDLELMEATATPEEISRFRLQVGDVLITKDSESWADIARPGLVVNTADDVVCGYHLAIVRPDPSMLTGRFLLRLLQSSVVNEQFQRAATGVTRYGLPKSAIGEACIPIPPLAEQHAIADFLDGRTEKLDRLITKKRRLIRFLEEKRFALITHSCTRGLPASTPERDTAASSSHTETPHPWLAELPPHWETRKLRYVLHTLDQGWSPVASSTPALEEEWGVLKLSAVRRGRFIPGENKALEQLPAGKPIHTPNPGDVLLSRANTPQRVGDACIVHQEHPRLIIPDLMYRLTTNGTALPEYLCSFLLSASGRAQIEADARGSSGSMVKLGQEHVRSLVMPLPPLAEQAEINRYLAANAKRFDRLIERVSHAIARLEEYRAALITAAVTGQIDVRGAAP